jgi:hypothetical protein
MHEQKTDMRCCLLGMALHLGRESGIYPGQACVSKRCPYLSGMHLKHMHALFMIYTKVKKIVMNGISLSKCLCAPHRSRIVL